jgi:hypothetical protein
VIKKCFGEVLFRENDTSLFELNMLKY